MYMKAHLGQYSICMYRYVVCASPGSPLEAPGTFASFDFPLDIQSPSLSVTSEPVFNLSITEPSPVSIHACNYGNNNLTLNLYLSY